jgi:polysaccharide biosynthesis transport protein
VSATPPVNQDWTSTNPNADQGNFDFVGMLQRRFWVIIVALLMATGGGVFWYWKSDVKYTSTAKAYIDIRSENLSIVGADGFTVGNTITSHDEIIRSETVLLASADEIIRIMREGAAPVSNALLQTTGDESGASTANVGSTDSGTKAFSELQGKNRGQILSHLSRTIVVTADRNDKNIYSIQYTCGIQSDCRTILGIVISQYEKHLGNKYESEGKDLLEKIKSAQQRIDTKITEARDKLHKWKSIEMAEEFFELRDGIFISASGKTNHFRQESQLLYNEIETLKQKKTKLVEDQLWIKGALASNMSRQEILTNIDKFNEWLQIEQNKVSPQVAAKEAAIARFEEPEPDAILTTTRFRVTAKQGEIQSLADRGFGDNYPGIKSLRRELDELKSQEAILEEQYNSRVAKAQAKFDEIKKLQEANQAILQESGLPDGLAEIDLVGMHQSYLTQQLSRTDVELMRLGADLKVKRELATRVDSLLSQEQRYQHEIDTQQALNETVLQKISEINLEKDNGGYILDLLNSPGGGRQTEPSVMKIFAVTSFLGLIAGVGLGYLIEIADKTFRTPAEVAQQLGMRVLGHVPVLSMKKVEAKGSSIDETIIAFHLPKSQQAEAFRAIRTSLFFSTQGKDSQIIQITSPTPGDGKSTLAANLSVAIAQSGKRVLILDADMRRPTVHYLFGIEAEVGFAAVLSGEAELDDAIIDSKEVDGLSVMPCGKRPPNPAELLTSNNMNEILEVIREKFDFVVVDSPPMLAVTDPAAVAARVDGVIMGMRIKKNVRLSANRAKEVLDSVGAPILGIVVNGAGMVQGTYSNSNSYGYGYGSGYGYSAGYANNYYSYGYDYGASSYYYTDENKTSENKAIPSSKS